ncbi:hypothetical protein LOTGIDRAFT_232926 [Lottia gigantea]|uniref:Helicase SKI2W n=1 Tax=Lottia gigantea TaxID=225164 RepID=V3ZN58_LOTGI|nr:hypothetical protein LOTGIDRAFT_232926 [Lottia gigantea]ESO92823.1 hypothetical protein LOTGIDRAFT_232926 [Lottia gigantea]
MAEQSDLLFDLLETGSCGHHEMIPYQETIQHHILPHSTLPNGIPPVLPKLNDQLEEYLKCLEDLPIHDINRAQRCWSRDKKAERLYSVDVCPVQTTIQVDRNPTTGQLIGFKESGIKDIGKLANNSLSLHRTPGNNYDDIRGSTTNYPFWPGGMDEPIIDNINQTDSQLGLNLSTELLSTAPNMPAGMVFKEKEESIDNFNTKEDVNINKLVDILALDDFDIDLGDSDDDNHNEEEVKELLNSSVNEDLEKLVQLEEKGDEIKPKVTPVKEEWAIKIDTNHPVDDFYKRIPQMAKTWPFEPDIFQKQAILHLENKDSVFVAAHTSAGKTVIAEYAIALSLKHMTKTIYTSPIKALSNQKFRDFKQTFTDVGLVTGDVQLNQTASCLIMTTEILRSMLYNGSDIIRDLEWVVFDEVHYINDSERGVVWEEVLIMLPQHCNVILLSATVPNTMEFANWVGQIKRKKIYVISTPKRPVPLEHYLYTGNSNKTNNELFLLIDEKGNFLTTGYNKAMEAKKERATKRSQSFGAKVNRGANPSQEKNIWLSVIEMLKKKDKLPAVAFTFSKRKIDENAYHLQSLDLTSTSEKNEIHVFFQKSINKLKAPDRTLPQVILMADMLKRGIGVHHSGILPILKEVVEMLFGRGLVKILFSTETFAMGVNMPARTVIFDSIRKHDGTNFRNLLPGEYIQMAGRAGRRGLDTTGTVIILCKGDVPEASELHLMMLGKPTKLESQFRLTYSMILNLLRVEQLRVEDMMKRSFSEFHSQKDTNKHKEALELLNKDIALIKDIECFMCSVDLEKYYEACSNYLQLKRELQLLILTHPIAMKSLGPGRVVIINNSKLKFVLGVILNTFTGDQNVRLFTVLVLCEKNSDNEEHESNSNYNTMTITPILANKLYQPDGPCSSKIETVRGDDIDVITVKTIKVEPDKIIADIKKRQQARFKDNPPSKSVSVVTQELLRLTEANPKGLKGLDPIKDYRIKDIDYMEQFRSLEYLHDSFKDFQCVHCPNFLEHFNEIRKNMELKMKYKELRYLLSDDSLILLPEYQQRIEVLRALNYIDEHNTVQLKGRVACEISTHELIINELVFENILTDLHPADIAAILSCMVFEQKQCVSPNLTTELEKGRDHIIKIATKISDLQKSFGIQTEDDYVEKFKFGLMEVVFEWARGLPFAEITKLTDVQEGIIVRCIQRLHETLRDVRNAARIIGDPVLYQKMEEASNIIKRDIVFAASLYTQ